MTKFLIDVNLPSNFYLWNSENFIHQIDISKVAKDEEIWNYAKANNLTIITKDSDFSNRILLSEPPPKVIHFKFGNLKIQDFNSYLSKIWNEILEINESCKLVNVFSDHLEGIE
ncbi:MAG: DUF5615 family PIN-like protein [Candidatus Kapabacteria bacterium]|nr:DUF5615 family PIN-like protein [Candidatus Kapabacteria bacterium]